MKKEEMPVGFGMALAMNPDAMQKFSLLSEEQKKAIVDGTHTVSSRDEMQRYVERIPSDQ